MFENIDILKIYFENSLEEYSVRDIAKLSKIAPSTASKVIKDLKNKKIIKVRKYKNILLSKANVESELYKDIKRFYNIQKLKNSGLIKKINEIYNYPTIILFGSYSKGEDVPNSDIDLAIFTDNKKNLQDINKFEKILRKELQIFYINEKFFEKNTELVNNMINGTIIQGAVKWISKNAIKTV